MAATSCAAMHKKGSAEVMLSLSSTAHRQSMSTSVAATQGDKASNNTTTDTVAVQPQHGGTTSVHWKLFALPPFFTPQPAPATLARQTALWCALLLDHAAYCASHTQADGTCALLRLYTCSSDIFHNRSVSRRLPAHAARAVLEALVRDHPNHAVGLTLDLSSNNNSSSSSSSAGDSYAVLVATVQGGYEQLEQSLLSWVLDVGAGTTTTMLTRKGAVMTFDELVAGKCLYYTKASSGGGGGGSSSSNNNNSNSTNSGSRVYLSRTSDEAVLPVGDVGALSEEQAIRVFLQALNHRPTSVIRPYKITLFNMDGSNTQPYQGVKFGGQ